MTSVEERVARVEAKMDRLDDLCVLMADLRGDIRSLNDKVDRDFRWLAGLQLTTVVTVIGTLVAALLRSA